MTLPVIDACQRCLSHIDAGVYPRAWIEVAIRVHQDKVHLFFDGSQVPVPVNRYSGAVGTTSGRAGIVAWDTTAKFESLKVTRKGMQQIEHKWKINAEGAEVTTWKQRGEVSVASQCM